MLNFTQSVTIWTFKLKDVQSLRMVMKDVSTMMNPLFCFKRMAQGR